MGWTARQVLETSLADFLIMRNVWKTANIPQDTKPGLNRKDAKELASWLEVHK